MISNCPILQSIQKKFTLTQKEFSIIKLVSKLPSNDATVETLHMILSDNLQSILGVVGSLVKKRVILTEKRDSKTFLRLKDKVETDNSVSYFIELNREICDLLNKVKYVMEGCGVSRQQMIETTEGLIEVAIKHPNEVTKEDIQVSEEILEDLRDQLKAEQEGIYKSIYEKDSCRDKEKCCPTSIEGTSHEDTICLKEALSKEEINQLKTLAKNLATQDNQGTANPYFYQVQDVKLEACIHREDAEIFGYYDNSCLEEYTASTLEELVDQVLEANEFNNKSIEARVKSYSNELDQDSEDFEKNLNDYEQGLLQAADDLQFEVEDNYYGLIEVYETKATFFTEQAAKSFIEENKHNFTKDVKLYVEHAWRNKEMSLVVKLLSLIK